VYNKLFLIVNNIIVIIDLNEISSFLWDCLNFEFGLKCYFISSRDSFLIPYDFEAAILKVLLNMYTIDIFLLGVKIYVVFLSMNLFWNKMEKVLYKCNFCTPHKISIRRA